MQKKLPIGIEDFKKLRKEDFYYTDKTGLIRDLLNNWGEVNLFTRPRRFGKTLTMSMLQSFFEIGGDKSVFDGLEISGEHALCEKYMGKFPVIFLSLKDVDAQTFQMAQDLLRLCISRETRRLCEQMNTDFLTGYQKDMLDRLAAGIQSEAELTDSLYFLSEVLHRYYQEKVIILIDEYDVPLDKAFDGGYFRQMTSLIRSMFGKALKTNEHLYFAVLTGCLRISKESIFTGMNNFKVRSILDVPFDAAFGFTDSEVRDLLRRYGLETHYEEIREWYDGYLFGQEHIYCPWDVLNYCDKLRTDPNAVPEPFWINSSSNSIVKRFVRKARKQTQRELEQLIAGEAVPKIISQELTYGDLDNSIDNLWSVLFTAGYLTRRTVPDDSRCFLVIPNFEIREIFVTQIMEWFQDNARCDSSALHVFCTAFSDGDPAAAEKLFSNYLKNTISIRDTFVQKTRKENFYHGILLGLLSSEEDWVLSSNAESGDGYSDILAEIEEKNTGIVIEVKYSETFSRMETDSHAALSQILDKNYGQKLFDEGMDAVHAYGIACCRKKCRIVYRKLEPENVCQNRPESCTGTCK